MIKTYCKNDFFTLYHGSMLEMLDVIEPQSIDAIVTDPPYELGFMGKGWDSSGIAFQKETWEKCFSVLKSGGYLLAFGGSRTFHRIACAIEDAGFEIRDCIMWIYGSGFPKSMNVGLAVDKKNGIESPVISIGKSGKSETHSSSLCFSQDDSFGGEYEIKKAQNEWAGWGTALKPAYEPIIVARRPVEKTVVENVLKYRTGAINIDECRIGEDSTHAGRFPANLILTYDETDFDEVCGGMPETKSPVNGIRTSNGFNSGVYGKGMGIKAGMNNGEFGDEGSASRYFYCAKASKKDRDEGLEDFELKKRIDQSLRSNPDSARAFGANSAPSRNSHPTVKPTALMQYLVRLVSPKGATILDCFNGSGSTGKAVMLENREREREYKYIGIELTDEYLPIAEARISSVIKDLLKEKKPDDIENSENETDEKQMSFFDLM